MFQSDAARRSFLSSSPVRAENGRFMINNVVYSMTDELVKSPKIVIPAKAGIHK
jgi:hypothetical protein